MNFRQGDKIKFNKPNYEDWAPEYEKYIGTTGVIEGIGSSNQFEVKFDIDGYKFALYREEMVHWHDAIPQELFQL